jgi:HEAT repeat protein
VDATASGLKRWFAALETGTERQRCRAALVLAALEGERQQATSEKRIDYTARIIDAPAVRRALLRAQEDASPLVRGAAVDALSVVTLDDDLLGTLAPRLSDGNFLVRMLAVDVLANFYYPEKVSAFDPVLKRLAQDDADPLVRNLCGLYGAAGATSRPTGRD